MARRRERAPALIRAFWGGGEDLERPRVVLVHPGAMAPICYLELATALQPRAELFVVDLEQVPEYFQAALTGGRPAITVPELASRVDDALWERGLLGPPWVLAGWAFGGVVGHALTASLTDDELPEGLFLLDTVAPAPGNGNGNRYGNGLGDADLDPGLALRWFAMYLAARRGAAIRLPGWALDGKDLDGGLGLVLDAAVRDGALRQDASLSGLRNAFRTYLDGLLRGNRLAGGYQPAPARVPVVLVRPEQGLFEHGPGAAGDGDALGWGRLAPRLSVERCAGDHYSMLRDPSAVRRIAEVARRLLVGGPGHEPEMPGYRLAEPAGRWV